MERIDFRTLATQVERKYAKTEESKMTNRGAALHETYTAQGMSQAEAAELLGFQRNRFRRILEGADPTFYEAMRLKEEFGVQYEDWEMFYHNKSS